MAKLPAPCDGGDPAAINQHVPRLVVDMNEAMVWLQSDHTAIWEATLLAKAGV